MRRATTTTTRGAVRLSMSPATAAPSSKWSPSSAPTKPASSRLPSFQIRRRLNEDLYVNFAGLSDDGRGGVFKPMFFPLVSWIWIGYWVLLFGTLVCLVPPKVRAGLRAHRNSRNREEEGPDEASFLFLGMCALVGSDRHRVMTPEVRRVGDKLACLCGISITTVGPAPCCAAEHSYLRASASRTLWPSQVRRSIVKAEVKMFPCGRSPDLPARASACWPG